MTQEEHDSKSSGEKVERLLKKLAVLEDIMMIGDKVFVKSQAQRSATVLIQAKTIVEEHEIAAGKSFFVEIEIANLGSGPVTLEGIEELTPCCGLELTSSPSHCNLEGSYLGLNGKVLEHLKIEKLRFMMRALEKGTYALTPRIEYLDSTGSQKVISPKTEIVNVREVVLPGRVSVGYKDLDNLLFGGIPEKYAVALTSISCDETMLIMERFLEKGARNGEFTFLVTVEASRWERLAEQFPNFNLVVCNPQAEIATKSLPNIVKLRGVENLTDISIPLFAALRKLDSPNDKPRRICIEILSDILLQHHAVQTRRWLIGLITELKSRGFTTLAIFNPHMHAPEEAQAVLDLFDGEIEVYEKEYKKFLRIKKMYGQDYISDDLPINKGRLTMMGTSRRWTYHNY